MVHYSKRHRCWFVLNLLQLQGSVFLRATFIATPAGVVSAIAQVVYEEKWFSQTNSRHEQIFNNNAIWAAFSFLVGFLVVFRTSHAYNRFWEGCTSVHKMGAGWFDACSALISFTRVSKASHTDIMGFQNSVIRLFSMLHAVALAELEDFDDQVADGTLRSFGLPLVDAGAFDDETVSTIRDSTFRVELVYQWIQALIVEAADSHVLNVPPPILTRTFQQLSGGMLSFCDALKVADTPFPFPYSQTCDFMLVAMYFIAPFVVASYVSGWGLAFFFTFVVIFTFTCLTLISLELEFPYGQDANDLDAHQIQVSMNHRLRLLISRRGWRMPTLRCAPEEQATLLKRAIDAHSAGSASFYDLWDELPPKVVNANATAASRRNNSSDSRLLRSYARPPSIGEPPDLNGGTPAHVTDAGDLAGTPRTGISGLIVNLGTASAPGVVNMVSMPGRRRPHERGIATESYLGEISNNTASSSSGEYIIGQHAGATPGATESRSQSIGRGGRQSENHPPSERPSANLPVPSERDSGIPPPSEGQSFNSPSPENGSLYLDTIVTLNV